MEEYLPHEFSIIQQFPGDMMYIADVKKEIYKHQADVEDSAKDLAIDS